jgi:hypothetical protein
MKLSDPVEAGRVVEHSPVFQVGDRVRAFRLVESSTPWLRRTIA